MNSWSGDKLCIAEALLSIIKVQNRAWVEVSLQVQAKAATSLISFKTLPRLYRIKKNKTPTNTFSPCIFEFQSCLSIVGNIGA